MADRVDPLRKVPDATDGRAKRTLHVARDFSPSPAGRRRAEGPWNAERFRDEILKPAIHEAMAAADVLVVSFEGMDACSSGFLEEAFGGLARGRPEDATAILATLRFSGGPAQGDMVEGAETCLRQAVARAAAQRILGEGASNPG